MEPQLAGPVQPTSRIVALDVLRGFALFGVFVTNLGYSSLPWLDATSPPDRAAFDVLQALFETKFVTLFSLLFGMGLVLQMQRAESRGADIGPVYRRRLAVLFGMGLVHGCLLFEGDILLVYSLVGALLFACRRWEPATLAKAALAPLAIGLVATTSWVFLEPALESADGEIGALVGDWGDEEDEARTRQANLEGPLSLTLTVRAENFLFLFVYFWVTSFHWRVVALFFLGAAAMKAGWIGSEHRRVHGRFAVCALASGLALEALSLVSLGVSPAHELVTALAHEVGSLVLAAGLGCSVLWIVHGGLLLRLSHALACTGRMALTNYLGQSVLMNVLLFWYGLGLWGALPLWQFMLIAGALFAVQVALSTLWLRRFDIGPMEWLWRTATYGERQTWRRT